LRPHSSMPSFGQLGRCMGIEILLCIHGHEADPLACSWRGMWQEPQACKLLVLHAAQELNEFPCACYVILFPLRALGKRLFRPTPYCITVDAVITFRASLRTMTHKNIEFLKMLYIRGPGVWAY